MVQVEDRYSLASEKLAETKKQHDELMKKTRMNFEKVENARLTRCMTCFKQVSQQIDGVYKVLYIKKKLLFLNFDGLFSFLVVDSRIVSNCSSDTKRSRGTV